MVTYTYNHCNGENNIPSSFVTELRLIIEDYQKELGLYSISDFKQYLIPAIHKKGWSDEFYLDRTSKITITSVKEATGLCVQTGNMARMYADLLKLQTLYSRKTINGGILILATSACGKNFGGNIASYERAIRELAIFNNVISMPLLLIGFDSNF